MNLDVIGPGPPKVTKWTSASVHVFVSDVSFELLNPFEDTGTEYADGLRVATAHCMISPVICGGLESEVAHIFVELSLV
jgi:hypothetical protein